jgi:multidrug efflux pump subunit AcrB
VRALRSSIRFFAITLVLMLSACATSGRVDKTFTPSQAHKTIFVSERQSETEARYINQVIRTFEKYGYEVTKDKTQAAYYLDFSITGGLVVTVEISLLRAADRRSVLNVSSTNSGWGTVIARPIATSGRVAEALSELDDVLSRAEAAQKQ